MQNKHNSCGVCVSIFGGLRPAFQAIHVTSLAKDPGGKFFGLLKLADFDFQFWQFTRSHWGRPGRRKIVHFNRSF